MPSGKSLARFDWKRTAGRKARDVDTAAGLRPLVLVEAASANVRPQNYIETEQACPWTVYEREVEMRVGDEGLVVAGRKEPCSDDGLLGNLVLVKKVSGPSAGRRLSLIQEIRDESIVSAREIFADRDCFYVVFEYMAMPLANVAGSPRLNETRLAAIMGQILRGIVYLESQGWKHTSLDCSSVLLHPHGDAKIMAQERCIQSSGPDASACHVESLGAITMTLMQGYAREGGAIGLDDVGRWTPDAAGFLSEMGSVTSAGELEMHPLLQLPWRKEHLIGLVMAACISTRFRLV